MNDDAIDSPAAIKTFLESANKLKISVKPEERYTWIEKILNIMHYRMLKKPDKSLVRLYIQTVTHYSRAQITRLIQGYQISNIVKKKKPDRHHFTKRYTRTDIILLAETDEAHQNLSGAMTKKLFERAYIIYKNNDYERLKNISVAHIYNLRKGKIYQSKRIYFSKTKSNKVPIGERRKPQPDNRPGYIRIDTVHQGDQDKEKGVYHINAVDEVTQFEVVSTVCKISESHLISVLEMILESFPFNVLNFHSDCGSEYINSKVSELLNKLHVEFTKSRSGHCNDNALAESKNGSVVRKYFGHIHIPQKWAALINQFNKNTLIPYLNFHRPCYFATIKVDKNGKIKKIYKYEDMMTPYEKLKSLSNAQQFLKPGIHFDTLDQQALSMTDLESAQALRRAQTTLFNIIFKYSSPTTMADNVEKNDL